MLNNCARLCDAGESEANHGDSHEIASDRASRWYAPLWRDDQEAGRDPQKRARHLFPGRRQEAKRRPVDACPLQGLDQPRARTVGRGGGRDQIARTGRRGAALVVVSRLARSSLRRPDCRTRWRSRSSRPNGATRRGSCRRFSAGSIVTSASNCRPSTSSISTLPVAVGDKPGLNRVHYVVSGYSTDDAAVACACIACHSGRA